MEQEVRVSSSEFPAGLNVYLGSATDLVESEVRIGDKTYRLVHPASAEALIDEEEFDHDERLPYWAEIWPSAIALARQIFERDLSGKRTIEVGCGVGLPSLVALDRGAEVTATDHYRVALEFARYNARTNTNQEMATAHLDWHSAPGRNHGKFDLVFAADVLYERRNVPALAILIPDLAEPDGEVLIADPRRKETPLFLEAMEKQGFRYSAESEIVVQEKKDVEVLIYRFRR